MPGGKKKTQRKRAAKKGKNRKLRSKLDAVTVRTGFPDRMRTKLKYVEHIDMATVGSPYKNQLFLANSVFDPNYTGTGHQPLYHDQYSAVYGSYRVLNCWLKLQINNASGLNMINCVVYSSTSSTPATAISPLLEQDRAAVSRLVSIGQQQPVIIKYKVNCATIFGKTQAQYRSDTIYESGVGSSPTYGCYIHTHFESINESSDLAANALYELIYDVEYFDQKIEAQS